MWLCELTQTSYRRRIDTLLQFFLVLLSLLLAFLLIFNEILKNVHGVSLRTSIAFIAPIATKPILKSIVSIHQIFLETATTPTQRLVTPACACVSHLRSKVSVIVWPFIPDLSCAYSTCIKSLKIVYKNTIYIIAGEITFKITIYTDSLKRKLIKCKRHSFLIKIL